MVVLLALVASYGRVTFGLVRPHVIVVLRMHAGQVAFWARSCVCPVQHAALQGFQKKNR
jgi:hypothetical protein